MNITDMLFEQQDKKYAEFQSKLCPTVDKERFIGVRVPNVRKIARGICISAGWIKPRKSSNNATPELSKAEIQQNNEDLSKFLQTLPHKYYDEDMLHGIILSEIKDYSRCVEKVDAFLPYVDNWAVCDIMSPKVFKKHKAELLEKIKEWTASAEPYTIRFGIEMLMSHYLDDDFRANLLEIPANVRSDEYYVKMMQAWFFATALTKQWDVSLPYITKQRLDTWAHNEAIQKARESRRFTQKQKDYLATLKK